MFYHYRLHYLLLGPGFRAEPVKAGSPDLLPYEAGVIVQAEFDLPQSLSIGLRAEVPGLKYCGLYLAIVGQISGK